MNKQDWEELSIENQDMLCQARQILGIKVFSNMSVPRGYVQDESTGTIYKLDTWLRKVRQGFVDANKGSIAQTAKEER